MSKAKNKVIVTCAITGSVHTPSMSPYLPVTPEEISQAAIEAAQAGATILHLHAREPGDGRPTQDPSVYAQFLPRIKEATDAVLNLTTGGSPFLPIAQRIEPAVQFQPEIASLNMGSMNFGMYEMAGRIKEFRHDWERTYLEDSYDLIFRNTFKDIDHILTTCNGNGTRFEIECYDIGHLYNAAHFVDKGLLKPPFLIQSVFGIRGGIGAHREDVMHMKRTADRLFGNDYIWSVLAAGRNQIPLATMSATLGGNVRVGLEDSLWSGPGRLSQSNAQQVTTICRILQELSLEVATPDDAREILQLKGRDNVNF